MAIYYFDLFDFSIDIFTAYIGMTRWIIVLFDCCNFILIDRSEVQYKLKADWPISKLTSALKDSCTYLNKYPLLRIHQFYIQSLRIQFLIVVYLPFVGLVYAVLIAYNNTGNNSEACMSFHRRYKHIIRAI